MKKIIYFLMLLVCVSLVAAATITEMPIPSSYYIKVTLVNQEPDPVEPGALVDVRFKVENYGTNKAEDITLEIVPEYPFSIYTGTAQRKIGGVYSRQIGDTGVIEKYTLKVDENAVAGENKLNVRYRIAQGQWTEIEDIVLNVKAQDALLAVIGVTGAEGIPPGSVGDVKINLKNMANFFVKDVRVKLNLNNKPFAPIGTTNEQILEIMRGGEEAAVSFSLMAEPDAASTVYKVPLELTYFDKTGTKYYKNQTIGVVIGDKPELLINVESSTVNTAGKKGDVVIKFVNRGLSEVKFLNVILKPSKDYVIISSGTYYIGSIDSDDYETAEFTIYANRATKKGILVLPLEIQYKDSNNKEYSIDYDLELKLYSSMQANKMGLEGGSNIAGTIVTILIVVLLLWLYKKKKFPFNGKFKFILKRKKKS